LSNINTVTISGRLTRDPELRHTHSGTAVCELGVAVNRSIKDESAETGWRDEASFIDVKVWSGRGEAAARKLSKGSLVFIAGRLEQERWETEAGDKRSKVVIVASSIEGPDFFKSADESRPAPAAPDQKALAGTQAADDDIPF
jgi:single-strand DNA-binding protein